MVDGIQDFIESIQNTYAEPSKTYRAEVSSIDNEGTVWVYLAGSNIETPTAVSSSEVNVGDNVNVEWRNNKLYIAGNVTNPSAGLVRVNTVEQVAQVANNLALEASASAETARTAAESAQASAIQARGYATDALTAAQGAQQSADSALVSLSTVEDVVGVLNWITAHGTMTANGSADLDPSKVYFIRDNNGDYHVGSYYYSIVSEPKAEDRTSYYTLSIDESVQNYVATHVVVDAEGLWIIPDSGGNKVLIATGSGTVYTTAGTYVIGKVNGLDTVFASFTSSGAIVGKTNGSHSIIDANGQRFYASNGITELANIGYGPGIDSTGSASNAPYYTFGTRYTASAGANNYDNTKTYKVGDLVKYDGTLYVCNYEITTPENWDSSHWQYTIGNYSLAEGALSIASGYQSHSEGTSRAVGPVSHSEGISITDDNVIYHTVAGGTAAHAEGAGTRAYGLYSHSEGLVTLARGNYSHAEGYRTEAGTKSHAEGQETQASTCAHAEGYKTIAGHYYSHAEGQETQANNEATHAEGKYTIAYGVASHAQNLGTRTNKLAETAIGTYNEFEWGSTSEKGTYAFIIGNGSDAENRSNAFTVDWDGRVNCGDYSGTYKSLFDIFYPVGSYYHTSDASFDPNVSWGGTWSPLGEGQVLLSAGSNYTAGQSYGGNTKSYTPSGSIGTTKLTDANIAHGHTFTQPTISSHSHKMTNDTYVVTTSATEGLARANVQSGSNTTYVVRSPGGALNRGGNTTQDTQPTASGGAVGALSGASSTRTAHGHGWTGTQATLNVMQKSVAVYIWHRTA